MCAATTSTADHDGSAIIAAVHPDVIRSHILNRIDGTALAAASCASTQFLSLCGEDRLWRELCNSAWPSTSHPTVRAAISALPYGHRSLYSDCFPSASCHRVYPLPVENLIQPDSAPRFLISAVDVLCDGRLIHSKIMETETFSSWFRNSPFMIDLLSPKENLLTPPLKLESQDGDWPKRAAARLRVSWILIDPRRKRAVNIAGDGLVEAKLHWWTGNAHLRYATVVGGGGMEMFQCGVLVEVAEACGGEGLAVREVTLQVEDLEGKVVAGADGLRLLRQAMEAPRRRADAEEDRAIYETFVRSKERFRERKERTQRKMDMACVAAVVWIFIIILLFFVLKKNM